MPPLLSADARRAVRRGGARRRSWRDLRERIRDTRWPDPAPGEPWSQGTDLDYLFGLLAYWADGFDWRAQERQLNRYEHHVAEAEGVRLHIIHHGRPAMECH